MKTRYQSAEKGPAARAPSPSAGSRPRTGATPSIVLSEPGGRRHQAEHDDERHEAAPVAERPAGPRYAAQLLARADFRKQRVDEYGGDLRPDQRHRQQHENRQRVVHPRRGEPEAGNADQVNQRERQYPRLPRSLRVCDRAQHGGRERHQHRACGDRIAPYRLAIDHVLGDAGGKIGAEDECGDDGVERLVGPVEEHPAPNALASGFHRRLPDCNRAPLASRQCKTLSPAGHFPRPANPKRDSLLSGSALAERAHGLGSTGFRRVRWNRGPVRRPVSQPSFRHALSSSCPDLFRASMRSFRRSVESGCPEQVRA